MQHAIQGVSTARASAGELDAGRHSDASSAPMPKTTDTNLYYIGLLKYLKRLETSYSRRCDSG